MSLLRYKSRRLDCPPCTNGGKRPRRRAVVSARARSLVRISCASSIDTCPRIRPTSRSSTRRPPQTDRCVFSFFSLTSSPRFSHLSQAILPIHQPESVFYDREPWRRSARCASGSMRKGGPCRRRRRVTTRAVHENIMQGRHPKTHESPAVTFRLRYDWIHSS